MLKEVSMSFFDWADKHWVLVGGVALLLALGAYEVLAGLGRRLAKGDSSEDSDE